MVGGSTMGSVRIVSSRSRPGKERRASNQPMPIPSTRLIRIAKPATFREMSKGSQTGSMSIQLILMKNTSVITMRQMPGHYLMHYHTRLARSGSAGSKDNRQAPEQATLARRFEHSGFHEARCREDSLSLVRTQKLNKGTRFSYIRRRFDDGNRIAHNRIDR